MSGPEPGTPEWLQIITASKVPSVLGLSPQTWGTPWALWHEMKGLMSREDTRNLEEKARGHYLEGGIVDWFVDRHPGATGHRQHWREVDGWAGATSDMYGHEPVDDGAGGTRLRSFVLNAKTAATLDDWWSVDFDGEPVMAPPPYYVASLLWEMWVHDAEIGYIAVLFGPNLKMQQFVVERDNELIAGVVARCREFYDSLAGDVPPDLDDTPATYEAVRRLHADIDRDETVDLDGATAFELVAATEAFEVADRRRRRAHAEVLAMMGRARLAQFCGVTVARRQPNRHGVSFVPVVRSIDDLEG